MKNLVFKFALIAVASSSLVACSLSTQTEDLLPSAAPIAPKPGAEFVSGSTPYVTTTPSGYKIQAALGVITEPVVQTTTPNGYKVYSSMKGRIISEESP